MYSKKIITVIAIMSILMPVCLTAATLPPSAGRSFFANDRSSFSVSYSATPPMGSIRNTSTSTKNWVMPLVFDSGGSKTIYITGYKAPAGSYLYCIFYSWYANGTPAGNVSFPSFTVGGVSTQSITTTIIAGTMSHINCGVGGNSTSVIYGVDYNR
jgi:hypothetical protein